MLKKYAWFLLAVLLAACARNEVAVSSAAKMQQADELFSRKKYSRAALLYEDISFERQSASAPVALMRLADCYYKMNKFTDARLKYTALTTSYPDFEEIETAYFRIGECYFEESLKPQYDQTETQQSIDAFRVFLDRFPNSDKYQRAIEFIRQAQTKVIQKKYHNGYIYYRMKDYSSALMYFKEIINLGNQDEIDRRSLYYATRISLYHKNRADAETFWNRLKSRYPDSRETKKLARHFS